MRGWSEQSPGMYNLVLHRHSVRGTACLGWSFSREIVCVQCCWSVPSLGVGIIYGNKWKGPFLCRSWEGLAPKRSFLERTGWRNSWLMCSHAWGDAEQLKHVLTPAASGKTCSGLPVFPLSLLKGPVSPFSFSVSGPGGQVPGGDVHSLRDAPSSQ